MNTFVNFSQELAGMPTGHIKSILLKNTLHERINNRGVREQFSSILLTHYDSNFARRKSKGTYTKGCDFKCNLMYN